MLAEANAAERTLDILVRSLALQQMAQHADPVQIPAPANRRTMRCA